jgi:Ca-activated chloride channel family protein
MGLPMQLLESAYHEITLARQDNDYRFELAAGTVEMDRDFVLSWQPVTGREPEAAVFTETTAEDSFALVMVMPPVLAATGDGAGDQAIAREMIFVIDTSGSMGGTPIQQARQSLAWALRQLGPRDYFNIIEFSSTPRALHSGAVPASRHYLQQAQEFVRQLNAGGGTEMSAALSLALRDTHSSADRPVVRQVVFITDGAVGNEAALFEQISRDLDDSRLFTVGIGSAPNSWFMRKAAQFGRGSYTFIGRQDEVGDRMQALFTQLASPVVTDIALRWSGDTRVESFPARIPDLYRGEPLLIAARLGAGSPGAGELQVSGLLGGSSWQRDLRYDLVAQEGAVQQGAVQQGAVQQGAVQQGPGQAAGVATLWARSKIADLLDQKVMGRPEQQVRSAVLEVALKHRLASPYTSFVAVEERISRPQQTTLDSRAVPNTQPQGQAPQPYAWPTTATSARGSTLLGSLLLFIALMTFVMRQPEVNHAPAV